ncbi:MAG: ABC transporter permease [Nitrospinota bacterium]|nr:MAG: ABC transporter permease [Nitrospinota bacterium]
MVQYAVKRLFQMVLVFFVVSAIIILMLVVTGDPIELMLPPNATNQQREEIEKRLGLDQPWHIQYIRFLKGALHGDLGDSFYFHEPALKLVVERLPASLELVITAISFSIIIAIPLGILMAMWKDSLFDRLGLAGSLLGISAPPFWVGILLILIFVVDLEWFPSSGRGSWRHLVLPATSLALFRVALFSRLIRAGMLDVMAKDYVRTARAKGLSEVLVVVKHALKNTLIPFVTIAGLQIGGLIAYTIVTEKIFAWPGMGRLLLLSIERLDYPVVVAYAMVTAAIFIILNFLVDVLYTVLDPRVRITH